MSEHVSSVPHPGARGVKGVELDQPDPLRLGFVRGTSPGKWHKRWGACDRPRSVELVCVDLAFGLGEDAHGFTRHVDVLLERRMPGAHPADGFAERSGRHAVRLYEEQVALVVSADHGLARQESLTLDSLAHVSLIAHAAHVESWPGAQPRQSVTGTIADIRAALDLVGAGSNGLLLPFPLARHLSTSGTHAVLLLEGELERTSVWVSWDVAVDGDDVQQLVGIMRGRTPRSSRTTGQKSSETLPKRVGSKRRSSSQKKVVLAPNSRGAQLAWAQKSSKGGVRRRGTS